MHHGDGRKYISIASGLAPFFYPFSLQKTKPGYETRSVLGPTTFVPPKTPKHRTHHISWQLPFYFEGSRAYVCDCQPGSIHFGFLKVIDLVKMIANFN